MYYISSKVGEAYGVTDTSDSTEEFYSKAQLLKIARGIDIDGVDLADNLVCVIKPVKETVRLFRQGQYHLALSSMTLENITFGLSFASNRGNCGIVKHRVLNISRSGVNSFSCDLGYSKSYRSGLTLDDILSVYESFGQYTLKEVVVGRL